jgi:hypothetical protein
VGGGAGHSVARDRCCRRGSGSNSGRDRPRGERPAHRGSMWHRGRRHLPYGRQGQDRNARVRQSGRSRGACRGSCGHDGNQGNCGQKRREPTSDGDPCLCVRTAHGRPPQSPLEGHGCVDVSVYHRCPGGAGRPGRGRSGRGRAGPGWALLTQVIGIMDPWLPRRQASSASRIPSTTSRPGSRQDSSL